MANIERRFDQQQTFYYLLVLDRYISGENILFVEACAESFLKKKCLKTTHFRLECENDEKRIFL